MPWSPLQFTEQIFKRLKKWGHIKETTTSHLHKAIILETMLIKPNTIKRVIKVFEDLGYIKQKQDNWEIKYWDIDD